MKTAIICWFNPKTGFHRIKINVHGQIAPYSRIDWQFKPNEQIIQVHNNEVYWIGPHNEKFGGKAKKRIFRSTINLLTGKLDQDGSFPDNHIDLEDTILAIKGPWIYWCGPKEGGAKQGIRRGIIKNNGELSSDKFYSQVTIDSTDKILAIKDRYIYWTGTQNDGRKGIRRGITNDEGELKSDGLFSKASLGPNATILAVHDLYVYWVEPQRDGKLGIRRGTVRANGIERDQLFLKVNLEREATLLAVKDRCIYWTAPKNIKEKHKKVIHRGIIKDNGELEIDNKFSYDDFNANDQVLEVDGLSTLFHAGQCYIENATQYADYIDEETAIVKRPQTWDEDNGFGDGIWRSSWGYASLLVIYAKDRSIYNEIVAKHAIYVELIEIYLKTFLNVGVTESEWRVPFTHQKFSRDQLLPLLYLLMAIKAYASAQLQEMGKDILKHLIQLDEKHNGQLTGPYNPSSKTHFGDNIRYLIDVLSRQYGINYKNKDLQLYLGMALGNIEAAKKLRRVQYKKMFTLALEAQHISAENDRTTLPVGFRKPIPNPIAPRDEYSHFNSLAAVCLLVIAFGNTDADVKEWRKKFKPHSQKKWGLAFSLVSGDTSQIKPEDYQQTFVTSKQDNDIVMAQRGFEKVRTGKLSPGFKDELNQELVLDYLILKAFQLLFQNNKSNKAREPNFSDKETLVGSTTSFTSDILVLQGSDSVFSQTNASAAKYRYRMLATSPDNPLRIVACEHSRLPISPPFTEDEKNISSQRIYEETRSAYLKNREKGLNTSEANPLRMKK